MFSVGCIQAQRCHLGTCPTGVTTQDPGRQRGLVVDEKGERAARFHRQTMKALADIVQAAGLEHPRDLRPQHLFHRKSPTEARPFDEIYSYIGENALLEHPDETPYADYWKAADPDSFKARYDIAEERQGTEAAALTTN